MNTHLLNFGIAILLALILWITTSIVWEIIIRSRAYQQLQHLERQLQEEDEWIRIYYEP